MERQLIAAVLGLALAGIAQASDRRPNIQWFNQHAETCGGNEACLRNVLKESERYMHFNWGEEHGEWAALARVRFTILDLLHDPSAEKARRFYEALYVMQQAYDTERDQRRQAGDPRRSEQEEYAAARALLRSYSKAEQKNSGWIGISTA